MWEVALLAAALMVGVGLAGIITFGSSPVYVTRELLMPAEVGGDQVTALMRYIAAVREPVVLRVVVRLGRVRFLLAAPESALASLTAALGGLLPEARLEECQEQLTLDDDGSHASDSRSRWSRVRVAARVWWDGAWPLLRADDPQLAVAATLGVLASAGRDEHLELRLRLWPSGRVDRPAAVSERRNVPVNPWLMRALWPAQPPSEEVRVIRAKYSGLLLTAEVFVISEAGTRALAAMNAQRVIAALRSAAGVRGVLRYRAFSGHARAARLFARHRRPFPWERSTLLSPEELTAVAGLPVQAPSVPGISYGVAPRLIPPLGLPAKGRVFAVSNFPATDGQPLAQPVIGGLQHTAIIGSTGSGKSTLIAGLVQADLEHGRGAFVLDLKGDLVSEILSRVPMRRLGDLVVLEPARGGAQPGLQLFPAGGDPELTSDLVLGTLQALFSDSWGVRSSQYLGLGLRTLAATRNATLVDLPELFTNAGFRSQALTRVTDPWLKGEWQRFEALSVAERSTHLSSPLTKISELVGRGRLRLVLGQTGSKLDFGEVLAGRRVVLVSLPPGLLGMPATRLLAALTLWQFFQAVEGRAVLAPEERTPFFAYVDEVAALGDLPLPLEATFERARGHGVGLTVSPQALSQLSGSVRASLLANVGTLVAFAQRSDDEARALAKHLPGVTPAQLQQLGRFEIALRLGLGPGLVTPTMTGKTLPPTPAITDAEALRRESAGRWGQTLAQVDAALTRRHRTGGRDEQAANEAGEAYGVVRRQS